jgi:hypothetical protein
LDKNLFPTYKVEFRSAQSGHVFMKNILEPHKRLNRDPVGLEGPTESGWLRQASSDLMLECPGFVLPEPKRTTSSSTLEKSSKGSRETALERLQGGRIEEAPKRARAMYEMPKRLSDPDPPFHLDVLAAAAAAAANKRIASQTTVRSCSSPMSSSPLPVAPERRTISGSSVAARLSIPISRPLTASLSTTSAVSSVYSPPLLQRPSSQPTRQFRPFTPHVLHANTFEVVLVLDSREMKGKNDRDGIARSLEQLGVLVEQRQLAVGDVIWIAREKGSMAGWGLGGLEIVLDGVLERKRVDDLVQSILGGRYDEQKVRVARVIFFFFFLLTRSLCAPGSDEAIRNAASFLSH